MKLFLGALAIAHGQYLAGTVSTTSLPSMTSLPYVPRTSVPVVQSGRLYTPPLTNAVYAPIVTTGVAGQIYVPSTTGPVFTGAVPSITGYPATASPYVRTSTSGLPYVSSSANAGFILGQSFAGQPTSTSANAGFILGQSTAGQPTPWMTQTFNPALFAQATANVSRPATPYVRAQLSANLPAVVAPAASEGRIAPISQAEWAAMQARTASQPAFTSAPVAGAAVTFPPASSTPFPSAPRTPYFPSASANATAPVSFPTQFPAQAPVGTFPAFPAQAPVGTFPAFPAQAPVAGAKPVAPPAATTPQSVFVPGNDYYYD